MLKKHLLHYQMKSNQKFKEDPTKLLQEEENLTQELLLEKKLKKRKQDAADILLL